MLQEAYLSRRKYVNSAELLSLSVCLIRLPNSRPEDSSFLCSLPDDSTHQLLQPQDDCPHLQEHFIGLHHPAMGNKVGGPSLDPRRDPLFHRGQWSGKFSACFISLFWSYFEGKLHCRGGLMALFVLGSVVHGQSLRIA